MFIKSFLALVPLTHFVLANSYCSPYGPKKVQLKANYSRPYSGDRYYVDCENLDDGGCPQKLDGPYGPYEEQKCSIVEQNSETTSYECKSSDDIYDFKAKAESKKWKCIIAMS